ncbi:germinal-center associated nuclear protein-like isoform X2 [Asterias rubens]|uniref:germinal-center associated nuclear protein-like isoform X2 n=1 Tax=Asterias rubens TaxID=7604 RepID=UPI001455D4F9|nr:germinal-center associated nuclear protein-like isoform X2 [Asterias rubens]
MQAQQYRADVKNSESVRFALKAFSAISSNNYVKFFKLVRSATYLNACIMHRYFMQVRNLALDVMIKAYTFSSTRGSNFPLVDISTSLAFDDITQASEFCQSHNLTVEDGVVTFSRSAFEHPDITPVAERSHSIIEVKNSMSIGEVVNGGPLPPEVIHHPMSSFDENGNYKGYTVIAKATPAPTNEQEAPIPEKDQRMAGSPVKAAETPMPTVPSTVPAEVKASMAETPYSKAEIKEAARGMFLEVIDEMALELSNSLLYWVHYIRSGSSDILDEAYEGVSVPMVAEIAKEVVQEQRMQEKRVQELRVQEEKQRLHEAQLAEMTRRRLEQEQQQKHQEQQQALMERKEQQKRIALGIHEDTLATVVKGEAVTIATSEIERQLRIECMRRSIAHISQELIMEVIAEEGQRVSTELIQMETAQRDQRLAEIEKAVLLGQQAKYLQRWYRVYTKRIRLRRMLLTFPAAPPNQSAQEQLRVLWAGRRETKEVTDEGVARERSGVTLESPYGIETGREKIAHSILRIHYLQNLRRQKAWSSLDLPTVLGNSFRSHHASLTGGSHHGNRQQHHYWKLVASLPASGSHDQERLCDWLKAKLRRGKLSEGARRGQLGDNDQVETLSLYSARVPHVSPNKLCTLSICTKVTMGSMTSNHHSKRNQLLGTSGILFALDPPSSNQNFWRQAKSRLDSILQAKPVTPPLPLVIALLDWSATGHAQSMCIEMLALDRLAEKGFLSGYNFLEVTEDVELPQNSQELSESLDWLATRSPPPPSLSEDTLKGYLDTGMTAFFSLSLYEDAKTRRDACLPEQDCCRVIKLYNATVRHLADVASSDSLTSLSWPPAEFTKSDNQSELPSPDWNSKKQMELLRQKILFLLLPSLPLISEDDDWQSVVDFCHKYLNSLPGSQKSKVPLFARVQRILEKFRRSFEDTCYLTYDAPGCEPLAGHVPWSRIIEECVSYMMSIVQTQRDSDDGEEGNDLTVFYIQSEFDAFEIPHTWRDAVNTTRAETFVQPPRFVSHIASIVRQKQANFIEKIQEASLIERQNEETPITVLEREPPRDVAAKNTATAVKTVLYSAKEESKKFDALLQQWLHGTVEGATLQDGATLQHGATFQDGAKRSPRQQDAVKRTPSSFGSSPHHVEQSLDNLRISIESEKRADRLAELRLANLLTL